MARTSFALLLLTSCVFVGALGYSEVASAQRYHSPAMARLRFMAPPPEAPEHGYRHSYQGGVQLVFDSRLAAYVVGGYSDRYFLGNRFFWHRDDQWRVSHRLEGPWQDLQGSEVPRVLQRHYAQKSSDSNLPVPARQAP